MPNILPRLGNIFTVGAIWSKPPVGIKMESRYAVKMPLNHADPYRAN